MAATAPDTISSATAFQVEGKDQSVPSSFISIHLWDKIFPRSLSILPLTLNWLKVNHTVPLHQSQCRGMGSHLTDSHNLSPSWPREQLLFPNTIWLSAQAEWTEGVCLSGKQPRVSAQFQSQSYRRSAQACYQQILIQALLSEAKSQLIKETLRDSRLYYYY